MVTDYAIAQLSLYIIRAMAPTRFIWFLEIKNMLKLPRMPFFEISDDCILKNAINWQSILSVDKSPDNIRYSDWFAQRRHRIASTSFEESMCISRNGFLEKVIVRYSNHWDPTHESDKMSMAFIIAIMHRPWCIRCKLFPAYLHRLCLKFVKCLIKKLNDGSFIDVIEQCWWKLNEFSFNVHVRLKCWRFFRSRKIPMENTDVNANIIIVNFQMMMLTVTLIYSKLN